MKKLFFLIIILCAACTHGQTSEPLCNQKNKANKALKLLLSEKKWNELFPNRYGLNPQDGAKKRPDFYTYKAFVQAATYFPEFLSSKNPVLQKRELAAFLANIAQETSGGWDTAPGGYFKWGLYFLEEQRSDPRMIYADTTKKKFPPVPGKSYHGRGPKQISWNYNYAQFSEAWYGSKDTLLQNPERIANDNVLAFASALWFWMTEQFPKPSCHAIMTGQWQPTENDLKKGRVPGFGATVNVINGGVECGSGKDMPKTAYRYEYYLYFCQYFHVTPGENVTCTNQTPFGQ